MKRIYISGKIAGLPPMYSQILFERAEKYLAKQGYEPVNPWKFDKTNCKEFDDYLMVDLEELRKCNGIYMLANWLKSNGAHVEYYFAKGMKDGGREMEILFEPSCENCLHRAGKKCTLRKFICIEKTDSCEGHQSKQNRNSEDNNEISATGAE